MCCKDKSHDNCCSLDMGRGCMFCNCGADTSVRVCEGCFKLHETDWLESMPETAANDIFEVRFKHTRRGYYKNVNGLDLKRGDIVAVESSPGHDIGIVSLTGDIVAKQMKRVGFNPLNGEFKKIYRKAKPYDIEKWQEAIALEHGTMIRSRQIAADMGLDMKIGDVEYQGDKVKAIFYYIADERVDFRELIKVFAEQFRIRIEMKQIGARQEAGRIGGLGSCGRELCCASWISSFVSVTTNSARSQEISLNPQKLAGQCSKLKCCLVYELDDYLDARREFPQINQPLQALDGDYHLVKTDILGRTMSFSTSPNAMIGMVTLPLARVKEVIATNKAGKKVAKLQDESISAVVNEDPGFVNMIGEDSITRFDSSRPQSKRSGRRGEKHSEGRADHNRPKTDGGGNNNRPQRNGENQGQKNANKHSRPQQDKGGGRRNQDNVPGADKPSSGNRNRGDRPSGAAAGRDDNRMEGSPGNAAGRPYSGRGGKPQSGAGRQPGDAGKPQSNAGKQPAGEGRQPGGANKPQSSAGRQPGNRNQGRDSRSHNRPDTKRTGEGDGKE